MPRFAANISFLFSEWAFLDRFAAAAAAGFSAVEFHFPYDHPPERLARAAQSAGVVVSLFNLPPGDFAAGQRGLACLEGAETQFRASVEQGLAYAHVLGVTRVHLMSGLGDAGDPATLARYCAALAYASEKASAAGVTVVIEPINPLDTPDYLLCDYALAGRLIAQNPAVKLLFDVYHRQRLHGEVIAGLARLWPIIGHIQIAGAPDRGEPDRGELRYEAIFAAIDALGDPGFVGCEYKPAAGTLAGLSWLQAWRSR